ncbi:MAG: TRAP transporter small permease [Thermoleophilia bacterium]|nr:TRAP transporter small permease [Thermoleophilia bacterium]
MVKDGREGAHPGEYPYPSSWLGRLRARAVRIALDIWNGRETEPEMLAGEEPPRLEYSRLDSWYTRFTRWLSYLAALSLGAVAIICFVDVIGWKFFGWTVPSAQSLIKHLNLVLVFLGVAYVQMDRGSIGIELLQNKFHRVGKLVVRMFGSLLGIGVCSFAAIRGWAYAAELMKEHAVAEGLWRFKLWPFQVVLVIGFAALALAFVFAIARDLTDFRKRRGRYA